MALAQPLLRSAVYELTDALDANELYQQNGWTDGLPIVPPTEERVQACLDAAGLAPEDVIGVEAVRQRPITAEKVAINAVMAGCLPTYVPIIVAALRAMCDEDFNLHGSTASTGGRLIRSVSADDVPPAQTGMQKFLAASQKGTLTLATVLKPTAYPAIVQSGGNGAGKDATGRG
jgi:hypothetical protein